MEEDNKSDQKMYNTACLAVTLQVICSVRLGSWATYGQVKDGLTNEEGITMLLKNAFCHVARQKGLINLFDNADLVKN